MSRILDNTRSGAPLRQAPETVAWSIVARSPDMPYVSSVRKPVPQPRKLQPLPYGGPPPIREHVKVAVALPK